MTLYHRLVALVLRVWFHFRARNYRLALAPKAERAANGLSAFGQMVAFDAVGVRRPAFGGIIAPPDIPEDAINPLDPVHPRAVAQAWVDKANEVYATHIAEQSNGAPVNPWRPFRLERGAP